MGNAASVFEEDRSIPLGRTGLTVPRLGVGTMNWGDPARMSRFDLTQMAYGPVGGVEEQRAAVDASVAAGAGLFDTAGMYGGGASERAVGEAVRGKRAFVATKFPSGLLSSSAGDLPRELEGSLRRLGRDAVELYQVHSPFPWLSIPRVMERMAEAVGAGKVGAVGVCNFSASQLRLAHRVLADKGVWLASVQIEYSLLHRKPETDGVLDACRELGVVLIAYMPLAMGGLTGSYAKGRKPAGFRRFMKVFRAGSRERASPVVGLLAEIASAHRAEPAQVALRWLIQQGNVVPIPGAKNAEQARRNARALSFSLASTEMEALDRATSAWRT
jgi:aryl-alcohol dehydrogenase-like predicted oxidoreductase